MEEQFQQYQPDKAAEFSQYCLLNPKLEVSIISMIKYLDSALCDKQHTICKELVCRNSLQEAMTDLQSCAQNPTKSEKSETTFETLDKGQESYGTRSGKLLTLLCNG